jgi:hypothetical protein
VDVFPDTRPLPKGRAVVDQDAHSGWIVAHRK